MFVVLILFLRSAWWVTQGWVRLSYMQPCLCACLQCPCHSGSCTAASGHFLTHEYEFFQLEPGESKDIYMPIVPVRTLMRGELNFHVSAKAFLARDDYYGSMKVIVSCFPSSGSLSYRVVMTSVIRASNIWSIVAWWWFGHEHFASYFFSFCWWEWLDLNDMLVML